MVVLDEYDALRAIDPWLCRVVVPALSDRTRLVMAGREAPIPDWPARLGELLQVIAVGNLPPARATALLAAEGVAAPEAARIERLARGHPLSLRLAAAALRSDPALVSGDPDLIAIMSPITRLYLDALDPVTRSVVDAACVVRRPTRSLLTTMLPDGPPDAFERLSGLPFVEPTVDGLAIHATVREVVAASLRADDPERSRAHRIAAWRALRREVADASPTNLWRYTADLLYLVENETIHDAFFPTTDRRYVVDEARPEDWPVIRQLSTQHFPGEPQDDLEAWWRHAPWAFRVARSRTGTRRGSRSRPSSTVCRASSWTSIRSPGTGATIGGATRFLRAGRSARSGSSGPIRRIRTTRRSTPRSSSTSTTPGWPSDRASRVTTDRVGRPSGHRAGPSGSTGRRRWPTPRRWSAAPRAIRSSSTSGRDRSTAGSPG